MALLTGISWKNRTKETCAAAALDSPITLLGAPTGFIPFDLTVDTQVVVCCENPDVQGSWLIATASIISGQLIIESVNIIKQWDDGATTFSIQENAILRIIAPAEYYQEVSTEFQNVYTRIPTYFVQTNNATSVNIKTIDFDIIGRAIIPYSGILTAEVSGSDTASWLIEGAAIHRVAGTVYGPHNITQLHADAGASTWSTDKTDVSAIRSIRVTGEAGRTISWNWTPVIGRSGISV